MIKYPVALMSDPTNRYPIIACLLCLVIVFAQPVFGNAAMPSISNVGTGNSFTPFFPADAKLGQQIAMQSEVVKVNLYPGFGVVKGEYQMFNATSKPITIRVGYPNNGNFINPQIDAQAKSGDSKIGAVFFNELAALKVLVNGQPVKTNMLKQDYLNWHVWSMEFAPQKNTTITVYYTIDTHNAQIKRGYNSSTNNGFAYILESGRLWKDKIQQGTVFIKLNDGLNEGDLLGVVPRKTLKYSQKDNYLIHEFTDLEPDNNSNILINYRNKVPFNFDFAQHKAKAASYYQQIDNLVIPPAEPNSLGVIDKDDFSVSAVEGMLMMLVLILILGAPMWIVLAIVIIAFWLYRRWGRNRSVK